MFLEARAKQRYLQTFDIMIADEEFRFEKRTKRSLRNEVNALISFGNAFLYQRIAEIFKPIIVDKVIFSVINKGQILKERHFERTEEGGVLLNKEGKRIFIHELEDKLYQKITINNKAMTYDSIIRDEVYKIYHTVVEDEKYKPFKYT